MSISRTKNSELVPDVAFASDSSDSLDEIDLQAPTKKVDSDDEEDVCSGHVNENEARFNIRKISLSKLKLQQIEHFYPTVDNKVDAQCEQFREYLEETGAISKMVSSFEKLMEAIEFGKKPPKDSMKTYLSVFGNGLKRKNELRTLNAEILKLESELDRIQDENSLLRVILKQPEPEPNEEDEYLIEFDDLWDDEDVDNLDHLEKLQEIDQLLKIYYELQEEAEKKPPTPVQEEQKEVLDQVANEATTIRVKTTKSKKVVTKVRQIQQTFGVKRNKGAEPDVEVEEEQPNDQLKPSEQVGERETDAEKLGALLKLTDSELERLNVLVDHFSDSGESSESEFADVYEFNEEETAKSKCLEETEIASVCERMDELEKEIDDGHSLEQFQDDDDDQDIDYDDDDADQSYNYVDAIGTIPY